MTTRTAMVWAASGLLAGMVAVSVAVMAAADLLSSGPPPVGVVPRFVAEPAGIDHAYEGDYPYVVGGGVAVFDCDQDALPDLLLAGGTDPASLYRNRSEAGGVLSFARVPAAATTLRGVTGAYPLDLDGDGIIDLAVLRNGANVVLRGLGDCSFEPADQPWDLDGGDELTVAFSATWEAGENVPTLVFANYVSSDGDGHWRGCSQHRLFRPAGDGYGEPLPLSPGLCTLSALFSDWDGSGRRDLRLTNDRHYYREGGEQLWRIEPGKPPRLYQPDDGWQPLRIWGMGIASHDLTGDGRPEVFLTSQADNKLQSLAGDGDGPHYVDIALQAGVTAHRPYAGDVTLPSTAWHADFEDFNNDGLVDLYVAKGNVEAMPDYASRDPNNLLLGQGDGKFLEVGTQAGMAQFTNTRGAAAVDLNRDGMLDLVEVNRRQPVAVWRNVGSGTADAPEPMGSWLQVSLRQAGGNSSAIGSWVEVRAGDVIQRRELTIGGGHAGGDLGWLHFGLGEARSAEIRVQWPDGELGPWIDAPTGSFVTLDRERGLVVAEW